MPEALTAFWTESKLHFFCSRRLILSMRRACRALKRVTGWLGRRRKPLVRASRIEAFASASEVRLFGFWQTTRTFPGACLRLRWVVLDGTAELSLRAAGTPPPAAGEMDVSGAGSGQYDGRSR